jgi:polar amino acid transport system substrate-binding protein
MKVGRSYWSTAKSEEARKRLLAGIAVCAVALFTCAAVETEAAESETQSPLRFCADPANMPFSSGAAQNPGIYVEIGSLIASALGRDVTTIWSYTYYGKRNIRTTLLAGLCDATVGLPDDDDFMSRRVIRSKPLLQLGNVVASPEAKPVTSLADLRGLRVGVQFESGPQNYLATRDDVQAVTFLDPNAAMEALAAGKVDAAFIWGPVAGYLNKSQYGGKYVIVPVTGPGMQWQATVGFSAKNSPLRDAVNAVLPNMAGQIAALLDKYGFPTRAAIAIGPENAASGGRTPDQTNAIAPAEEQVVEQQSRVTASDAEHQTNAATGNVDQGREIYNGTCAHCHGTNAVQSERRIDLRLLRHRYGEDMDKVFQATVTQGRPSKGMPAWRDVFTDEQFSHVLSYLHTLQRE